MTHMFAPIALFTYNRADHTRKAVESLLQNAEAQYSDLFIFSDGAKTPEKQAGVDENRKYIHSLKDTLHTGVGSGSAFKSITIIEREKNWGLANSLIAGITEVINQYGRVIVVEDDLILSPYFLQYMNTALEKYKDEDKVGAISADTPDVVGLSELPNTFFLYKFHCWGWATWKRSWELLNTDVRYLLRKVRLKIDKYAYGGYAGDYGILYCQKKGLVDSWYILFYTSLFLNDKLVLFPGDRLIRNIGQDGTGTHCKKNTQAFVDQIQFADKPVTILNIDIREDVNVYEAHKRYLKKQYLDRNPSASIYQKIKFWVRRIFYIDCL